MQHVARAVPASGIAVPADATAGPLIAFEFEQVADLPADQPQLADLILDGNYWHNPRSERTKRVMDAYQRRFTAPMSSHSVQAYSAMMVLRDAIERAGSADRARVREALTKTDLADHILPQGPIRFDRTGENTNAQPALLQNQGGRTVVVGPAPFAEAKAVFPVPRWGRS